MHGGFEPIHYVYILLPILSLGLIFRVMLSFRDQMQMRANVFLRAREISKAFSIFLWGTGIPTLLAMLMTPIGIITGLDFFGFLSGLLHIVALSTITYLIVRLSLSRGGV